MVGQVIARMINTKNQVYIMGDQVSTRMIKKNHVYHG